MLSKEYDLKEFFIKNLILLNKSSLEDFKKTFAPNVNLDKVTTNYFFKHNLFFDKTTDPGQNYFIITDKEYSFLNFMFFILLKIN